VHFGGDYNPEQWDPSVWREDARLMREAGVDMATVGVFSWASVERREGAFDFAWLDEVLALMHEADVQVDLATGTASPPNWACAAYPDILPIDASGAPYHPGSRQHFSASSQSYRRLATGYVGKLVERYRDHPAVALWHVNNEYACHVPYDYSDAAAQRFRDWLRARYGDLDAVNAIWNTAFWSQRYASFDEIIPPRRAPYSHNPGLVLDFRRFTSDVTLELLVMERDVIRAAGATQPVTTNFMDAYPTLDYWRWAREVDIVSNDNYSDPRVPDAARHAAFGRDLMRSLKPTRPWILMEQAANTVSWRANNARKSRGQMSAWSEQAVARGAGAILFFQWRQSVAGSEKFHSAMLPHAGADTPTFREISVYGARCAARAPVGAAPADVALLIDWENWWALDQPDHPAALDYERILRDWYEATHRAHVQLDFAHPSADLSAYALVIAPALYLLDDRSSASLSRYVANGGVLVTTSFTDVVDEHDRFRPGGFARGLGEVFGAAPIDFWGVADDDAVSILRQGERIGFARRLREELRLDGAVATAAFDDGAPAIVEHGYGQGSSIHVAAQLDRSAIDVVLARGLALAHVLPVLPALPEQVEAIRTNSGVTLINQSAAAVEVAVAGERFTIAPYQWRERVAPPSSGDDQSGAAPVDARTTS
jgi:beta-galactosidase